MCQVEKDRIMHYYRFEKEDSDCLVRLRPLFEAKQKEILDGFYGLIFSFPQAKAFLKDEKILCRHRESLGQWLTALFSGQYNEEYFFWLRSIREIHIRIGLPSRYALAAFSFIRETIIGLLLQRGYQREIISVNKILDINLDIIGSYKIRETEVHMLSDAVLLRRAIQSGGILPYVQPVFDAGSGKVAFYECLMRIQDPDSGEIHSIASLIGTAKRLHLYDQLAEIMVGKSMDIFRDLPDSFSLNLSYRDIVNETFIKFFKSRLKDFPNPKRIILEILETDLIEDFEVVNRFIREVKELGCSIAVDDFGAGYSNIRNLLSFNPDYLKIDGVLIEAIPNDQKMANLVGNILQIAGTMGAKVVAEYVSSKEIYENVVEMGIDYLQGFYLAKPFPAAHLILKDKDPEGSDKRRE